MSLKKSSVILGAAFLMATSAIGPGFITQTTVFTQQLLTSFGFVILISIILDIAAQLNIWRIISIADKPAQVISNELFPGMGYVLSGLIVFGGLAFNIGNVAGAGLGLNILIPVDGASQDPVIGAMISALIALAIFWFKEAGNAMDIFSKVMGGIMIALTCYIAIISHPPVGQAIVHSIVPQKIDFTAIITIVGGTVGGYISFAGAHRLLDAGITGPEHIKSVSNGSIKAILIASAMRILLFLAALGVVIGGGILDAKNPAASVFSFAAGIWGLKIFGIVLWSAAITSVVGSAYTSISFLRSFHPIFDKYQRLWVTAFILISTLVFSLIGKPIKVLIFAGALNGLILPFSLGIILIAVWKKNYLGTYKHPRYLSVLGWVVVMLMLFMGINVLTSELTKLL